MSAAIVVDARKGSVLYSYNSDARTQPASIAKMMTLFIIFKALKQKKISLYSMIKISPHAAAQAPCKLGLKCGSFISVRDAILSLVTQSANDIAVALAEFGAGGSEQRFVSMMNKEAKRLKMNSTVFLNPSGWKNAQQVTTAHDIAKLSMAILKECPDYYNIFSTKEFAFNKKVYKNHNTLLGSQDGIVVDGIKTGFVNASGYNIAVSARKGKDRIIVVVLGGRSGAQRDMQAKTLLKEGFLCLSTYKKSAMLVKNYKNPKIIPEKQKKVPVKQGKALVDATLPQLPLPQTKTYNVKWYNRDLMGHSRLFENISKDLKTTQQSHSVTRRILGE
ncbi:hypothetical protein FACS189449_01050 [Alphaproteobacteria bacterium]|nr:hypothetical protein FACS189449_01050 [Alphaproteobacteria bacterium]